MRIALVHPILLENRSVHLCMFQLWFWFADTTDTRGVGTCIGALFVDQSINGATADVERWLDIYETAQHVVNVCVTRHGFGGKNRGDLGENNPMHHALLI